MSSPLLASRRHRRLWMYDPLLAYRYIPGLRARIQHEGGGYLMRVNKRGFRCAHEFRPAPANGARRIMLFGDSFTSGTGVSDRLRYGERLEASTGAEVFNLAMAGVGLDQQLLVAETTVAGFARDLAIIGVWTDTIRRVCARYGLVEADDGELWARPKPYFRRAAGGALELCGVPVPRQPVRLTDLPASELAHVPIADERHRQVRGYEIPGDPQVELLLAVLRRFVAALRCPVVLLLLPAYRHIEELADAGPAHRAFKTLHRPPSLVVHDTLPDMLTLSRAARRRLRFASDYHPTADYHRLVAESVHPIVAEAVGGPALVA